VIGSNGHNSETNKKFNQPANTIKPTTTGASNFMKKTIIAIITIRAMIQTIIIPIVEAAPTVIILHHNI
jgi:hypothetical protein